MFDLKELCSNLVRSLDEALAVAVVDVSASRILAVAHTIPSFSQQLLEALALAAVDMFRGRTVSNVEKLIAITHGTQPKRLIREVQMTTQETLHFMSLVPGKQHVLVVLVTTRKANLGTGWTTLRGALTQIEPLCP